MATTPCNEKYLQMLKMQGLRTDKLYNETARSLAVVMKRHKVNPNVTDVWKGVNSVVEKDVDKVFKKFANAMTQNISQGISEGWTLSNVCNDVMVNDYINGIDIKKDDRLKLFSRNTKALEAFTNRKVQGMNLSDRVWKISTDTKAQLEQVLSSGILEGKASQAMTTDLRKFLKEPNKLFRRVKDEKGNLKLSKPAMDYHPGRGVYRSSYKNALRLARNEVNIAYHTADNVRRRGLPFVLGFKVNLSNAHKVYDICDEMTGEYPKEFLFTGWHTNCLCYTTSVKLTKAEFIEHLNGKPITKQITDIPDKAKKFVSDNAEKIKGLKSPPYFIKDNFKDGVKGFDYKPTIAPTAPTVSAPTIAPTVANIADVKNIPTKNISKEITTNAISKEDLLKNEKWFKALSKKESGAIKEYSTGYYQRTNDQLRGIRDDMSKYTNERISLMQNSLKNAPKIEIESYRGMSFYEKDAFKAFEGKLKEGGVFIEKGFLSTSYDKGIVKSFISETKDNVIFNIKGKNGVLIDKLTQQSVEKEILFNSGSKFEILKIKEELKGGGFKTLTIDMIEL